MDYFNHSQNSQIVLQYIKTMSPSMQWAEAMHDIRQARQQALSRAQQHTGRSKLLLLIPPKIQNSTQACQAIEVVPTDSTARLCQAIATSNDRIAAIIMSHQKITPYYARKVRELASAEGALMIWDISSKVMDATNFCMKISKNSQPDMLCFCLQQYPALTWLAGRDQI